MTNTLKTVAVAIALMAGMTTASYAQLYPEHFRYDSASANQSVTAESAIPKQYRLGR